MGGGHPGELAVLTRGVNVPEAVLFPAIIINITQCGADRKRPAGSGRAFAPESMPDRRRKRSRSLLYFSDLVPPPQVENL